MRRLAAFACSSIATVALGLSVALPLSFAQNANSKIEQSTQVFSTDFSHSESASSGSVTLTASWNDPQLGSPTTFHVEGTGGSGKYLFRMDAPSYSNPGEYAFESVADPSRGEWTQYTSEATSHDYEFTMTASGTYNFRFFVMDKGAGVYYLRLNVYIQVSDPNYPSVSDIVSQTVSQSEEQTDGTEYAKAVWLHDWLIDQMKYDSSLKWSSAESALTRGLGTCQSYESAYSSLLAKAGIENAETRDTADGHTWNAVKLDGEWYQVDATWDDSDNNWYGFDQRHLYFGLTDELMAIAHPGHTSIYQADGYGQRSISLKDNYFIRSGEADQWADKYAERIQSHLDDLEESFMIGVDNANDPPSIRNIINGIIAYALNQKSWHTAGREAKLEAATNDTSFTFSVKYADVSVPVESVSVSGDGVKDGKLSLKSGASVQLTATVKPDNATDRKVTWTSSDSSVANVMGTGVVTAGSKAGTATIKATAGGKSASVQVTVTGVPKQPMTVWYKPDSSWKTAKVHYQANGKWTGSAQRMTLYRNGWYRYTIPDTAGGQVRMAFTDGGSAWDNNGGQGKDYRVSGSVVSVSGGKVSYSAPSFDESPMTVWYKPDSSWKTAKVNYQANGKWSGGAQQMEASCGGWYRYTIPDTAGGQVRMAFTDGGSVWDNNGGQGKDYRVSGDSVAVAGGQMITDVTPNCTIRQ
ncbi:Ig-like domain-containing protein [Bifidobacterium adolescentis]|uniref:Ig-like domain-containing protein n=3 Tax=Bifidobacterium adolescentis TaxID=1680 RepID=UPI0034A299F4